MLRVLRSVVTVSCLLILVAGCGDDAEPTAPADMDASPPPPYRYLMFTDTTMVQPPGGDNPGADLDAVGIRKSDGTVHYASRVVAENTEVSCMANTACYTDEILGMPDGTSGDDCEAELTGVVSTNGGRITVSFDDGVTIENGDMIVYHLVTDHECAGEVTWVELSTGTFSVSREPTSDFVTIGTPGDGLFPSEMPISEL